MSPARVSPGVITVPITNSTSSAILSPTTTGTESSKSRLSTENEDSPFSPPASFHFTTVHNQQPQRKKSRAKNSKISDHQIFEYVSLGKASGGSSSTKSSGVTTSGAKGGNLEKRNGGRGGEKNRQKTTTLKALPNGVWSSHEDYTASETISENELDDINPYQRLVSNLSHNERWQKEVALGRRVGFYRIRGDIGAGNFSQVKIGMHCLAQARVAVKILEKSKLDAKTQKMLTREINTMESLHHPNAIRLYEVIETLSRVHLIMEYASGGELFQKINSDGKYEEDCAKCIFSQIVSAIAHMHQHHIIHRDIKAENIFISGRNLVKVGDYGFSTQIRYRDDALNTFCGSPPYAAPELFKDENYIGPYVDIWALGVLLFFIVTGAMPFKAQTVAALKKLILETNYEIPEHVSANCRQLITAILQRIPSERLTMNDILSHAWLSGQNFPEPYEKYNLLPTEDPENAFSIEEQKAREQMRSLGISEELIKECADRGSRSAITGTYRILLHKIQMEIACGVKEPSCRDLEIGSMGNLATPPPEIQENFICDDQPTKASASNVLNCCSCSQSCVLL